MKFSTIVCCLLAATLLASCASPAPKNMESVVDISQVRLADGYEFKPTGSTSFPAGDAVLAVATPLALTEPTFVGELACLGTAVFYLYILHDQSMINRITSQLEPGKFRLFQTVNDYLVNAEALTREGIDANVVELPSSETGLSEGDQDLVGTEGIDSSKIELMEIEAIDSAISQMSTEGIDAGEGQMVVMTDDLFSQTYEGGKYNKSTLNIRVDDNGWIYFSGHIAGIGRDDQGAVAYGEAGSLNIRETDNFPEMRYLSLSNKLEAFRQSAHNAGVQRGIRADFIDAYDLMISQYSQDTEFLTTICKLALAGIADE